MMSRGRYRVRGTAIALAIAVSVLGACNASIDARGRSTGPSSTVSPVVTTRTVTVWPVTHVGTNPSQGVATRVDVTMSGAPGHSNDVVILGGTGSAAAQLRASAWSAVMAATLPKRRGFSGGAVMAATLLNGSGFSGRRFTFQFDRGVVDRSSGALFTVAVLALLRGDSV